MVDGESESHRNIKNNSRSRVLEILEKNAIRPPYSKNFVKIFREPSGDITLPSWSIDKLPQLKINLRNSKMSKRKEDNSKLTKTSELNNEY